MNNQPIVRLRSLRMNTSRHSCSNLALLKGNSTDQSGAVLIISLIMLLLLTIIGASSMQTTSLEEKMAGNLRDRNLAFQAAESALKAAEASLVPPLPTFTDPGTGGFYSQNSTIPTSAAILTDSFWTTNPKATSSVTTLKLGNGITTPVYIIQVLGSTSVCLTPPCIVRITVRATGASTNTVVILQSVYSID